MEFVDLGLSVKWATCNIGATNPEDYDYDFPNNEGIAFTDTDSIKVPTVEQAEELCRECSWEIVTHKKGKYEWKVTGKNGKFILLPASYKEYDVEWKVGNYKVKDDHHITFGKYAYGVNDKCDVKCNIRAIKVPKAK